MTNIWRLTMTHLRKSVHIFIFFVLSIFSLSSCNVHYIADYDSSVKDEIVQIAKNVDLFWGEVLDISKEQRSYSKFKDQYNQIETEIRGLVIKNEIRPLNEASTKQAKIALDLWIEDRTNHRKNNTISDFEARLHRQQYLRAFIAMAKGEEAKKDK